VGKRKQGAFQRPKFKSNADDTSQKERKEVEVYLNNKHLRQVKTIKYLGVIIEKTNVQRTHYTRDRKVQENNICPIEVSETKLGTKP
jgi:hypothetical protein